MGGATLGTAEPADAKADHSVWLFDRPFIVPMYMEADRVPTGTGQLVKLYGINN